MQHIETRRLKPDPDRPHKLMYDGQRTAQEIFAELCGRLESANYLPDEYFLLNRSFDESAEWPEEGEISCSVDYGGSEGIYLDVHLNYTDENGKYQSKSFATGKTLDESDDALDRMYLIASAVTKAFHSDGVHARYVRIGEPEPPTGAVVHLNSDEKAVVTNSLIDTRLRLKEEHRPFEMVEKLIRRITDNSEQ
jgi:hypothetical protein